MEFDNTALQELIRSLRSNPTPLTEKRRQPRVGVRARAHILVEAKAGKQAIAVLIHDLSAGGLGLTCALRMDRGDKVTLLLARDASQSIRCEVAHCIEVGCHMFRIGARFIGDITSAS